MAKTRNSAKAHKIQIPYDADLVKISRDIEEIITHPSNKLTLKTNVTTKQWVMYTLYTLFDIKLETLGQIYKCRYQNCCYHIDKAHTELKFNQIAKHLYDIMFKKLKEYYRQVYK